MNNNIFGKRLRELRLSANKTQAGLAKDLFCGYYAFCSYEYGRTEPGLDFIVMVADYFGVTTDYLLGHNTGKTEGGT